MDQKWVQRLVILVLYQQIASGTETVKKPAVIQKTVKEGDETEIKCQPGEGGTMVVWFRVPDNSAMEFIGSFSPTGTEKKLHKDYRTHFDAKKIGNDFFLKLKSFKRDRDSGVYSCTYLYRGNELRFGDVTRLRGEGQQVTTDGAPRTTSTTATQAPCTSPPRCACEGKNKRGEKASSLFCAPIIVGPLGASCGLLLLLLCISIFYCNRIRTRRCPHHHKRKPRMIPLEKQMMTNTHI